ncbi:cyanophycinase [Arthrobacter sp. SLBN-112]|jgi:cyanophycinase|uniref:Type 1 glutamine amidotransferase-like domain-containing protein n=1 Tax=Arthrobacter sp. SLBN-112 TaxID=2768452 RepID=UPI00114E5BC8|nr:Type 1 glutamine amidotransferase-like domain-containing protein [Arthrobacter sp. SLBN-112]TQJ38447.1 cyanophycinase [Arthrobacter sp. SLBN-112]
MSIFLAGAGPDPLAFPEVFDRFTLNVREHAGGDRQARIAVAVHHGDGNLHELVAAYAEPLRARIECEIVPIPLLTGKHADAAAFDEVDAIVVGGGLTPAYWKALHPLAAAIRRKVADGAPYLGFSAGAMVASRRTLVGGYRINGVEVCGQECSEGLDSVDIREGLGLAAFSVDVHAAQAGTLSRAVGAVAAGLMERAVAIDESTAVVLPAPGDLDYDVIGSGNCWDIHRTGGAATAVVVRSAT